MACDKVVDSAQLDGAMTATADAIRSKTGESAPIQWDAGTGFAAAIAAIAAGSGSDSSGIGLETGTYTPSEDIRWLDVEVSQAAHDGCIFLTLICENSIEEITELTGGATTLVCAYMLRDDSLYAGVYSNRDSYATIRRLITNGALDTPPPSSMGLNNYISGISQIDNTIRFAGGSAASYMRAGLTYRWSVYYSKEATV